MSLYFFCVAVEDDCLNEVVTDADAALRRKNRAASYSCSLEWCSSVFGKRLEAFCSIE